MIVFWRLQVNSMGKPVILIVEDERITSIYMAKLLKANGYDVMGFASSGGDVGEVGDVG